MDYDSKIHQTKDKIEKVKSEYANASKYLRELENEMLMLNGELRLLDELNSINTAVDTE